MKTAMTIVMALVLTATLGCETTSPRGGDVSRDEGFKIAVPRFSTEVNQGDRKTVTVSLQRGKAFMRDVTLELTPSPEGISVEPTEVVVRGSDSSDVRVRITADENASLGEYRVRVRGTPETGESTAVEFKVKVVTP